MATLLPQPLASLLFPWEFMAISLAHLPATVLSAILSLDLRTLLSPGRLRAAWFGRFWARVGPVVRDNASGNVVPLLQGRTRHGAHGDEPHHPPLGGVVLEVGPGSGMWVSLFSPRSPHGLGRHVTHVYGVEPNAAVHPLLRQQVAAAGLDDGTYEIVPVGIEALAASGRVAPESVDCIVTIMCLCSIPEPRRNIAELYRYLKPGGRWYVYEHVRCFPSQGRGMRLYQGELRHSHLSEKHLFPESSLLTRTRLAFLNLLWPRLIGGCEMARDTAKFLREAGPWSDIDLCPLADEPWYFTMPHIIGVLTK